MAFFDVDETPFETSIPSVPCIDRTVESTCLLGAPGGAGNFGAGLAFGDVTLDVDKQPEIIVGKA